MFDLHKDIETYKGITPYASEHYGVYQPLLGWESKLTKKWIKRGGVLVDPRIKSILDGRLKPGPESVQAPETEAVQSGRWIWAAGDDATQREHDPIAVPLLPGSMKSPFKVLITKDLRSELLKLVQAQVQTFVDNNNGDLPTGTQWNKLIDQNNLMNTAEGPLRVVNSIHWRRLLEEIQLQAISQNVDITQEMIAAAEVKLLEIMQYESQIARFLLAHVEGQGGLDPNELKKLFFVQEALPLSEILRSPDPLNSIDPNDKTGALSPVGFVHLFRQYFFDLGTFLGEPVEHIWLAPGTTIELIEVSTRKTIVERIEENSLETTTRSEQSSSVKDELSDAIKSENESSTKLGFSTTQTVTYPVYQGTATASLGIDSTRKDARETSHKQNREQAEKLSFEIKRSFKSVFKTVTETTDTRSRRYVLQNTGTELRNYELRRKMRRVGVQLQDIGERLCWQVFIDDAGANLGLGDLVHFAESPDLSSLKKPEIGPKPAPIKKTVTVKIPFKPLLGYDDNGPNSIYGNTRLEPDGITYSANRVNTDDEDAEDSQVIMGPFTFKFEPPQNNYVLSKDIRILGPQGNKLANARAIDTNKIKEDGTFELIMEKVNFGGGNEILVDVDLIYTPTAEAQKEYDAVKAEALKQYNAEKQQLLEKSYIENVRKRIKDASNIKSRPSWDLREEERTVVYRQLINRLMLDSWKLPDTDENRRLSHVRSEVIRSIFDVDSMLYFVAPEWWMPRRHRSQFRKESESLLTTLIKAVNTNKNSPLSILTNSDERKWGDIEQRDDNYKITEDSTTAKLGSSLGWLLQLDGDNLRNAFLNAPWVKAIIPIRPGREKAALNWLRAIEGHENDGWNIDYPAVSEEDIKIVAELESEDKPSTIGNVLEKIAEKLENSNNDIKNVLEADKVFEHGFDPLAGGFDAGLPANQVFSQWISVLPTDQIVAVEYKATELFEP